MPMTDHRRAPHLAPAEELQLREELDRARMDALDEQRFWTRTYIFLAFFMGTIAAYLITAWLEGRFA